MSDAGLAVLVVGVLVGAVLAYRHAWRDGYRYAVREWQHAEYASGRPDDPPDPGAPPLIVRW